MKYGCYFVGYEINGDFCKLYRFNLSNRRSDVETTAQLVNCIPCYTSDVDADSSDDTLRQDVSARRGLRDED